MDFSFIVTVYNMEKYVADCLDSIINQTTTDYDYEVVVVNDGSKDSSLSIIREYENKYPNVIVVDQSNGGLSNARNNGLKVATGRWVWFIDSDDMVERNSLSIIRKFEKEHDAEAIIFSVENFSDEERYIAFDRKNIKGDIYTGRDMIESNDLTCQVPFTIYKRAYLVENNFQMVEGIYHEDLEFSPRTYYGLQSVGVIKDIMYYRRITPNSITHAVNFKKNFDLLIVLNSLALFSEKIPSPDKPYFYNILGRALNNTLYNCAEMDKETKKKFRETLRENIGNIKRLKEAASIKYKIQGYIYCMFPNYIMETYRMLYRLSHL